MNLLSPETVGPYLERRGIVADGDTVTAEPLGGGVSNVVLAVEWDGERAVLKQPRPNLAVAADWPADVDRVHNEAAAAWVYADRLDDPSLRIPSVRFEDRDDHVVLFEAAPRESRMWKTGLLDGRVEPAIAQRLGRVLGRVQAAVADDADVRSTFANDRPFEQLRLDPYHRTVADRHPEFAPETRAEIERLGASRRSLVHGDFSPKNVLVDASTPEPVLWVLDFEVAHWGDPAFDPAFMCTHLCIKAVYNAHTQGAYLDAMDAFWAAYETAVPWDVEAAVLRELPILMLARVDGKSPVEYVTEDATKETLRTIATAALRDPPADLNGFRALLREVSHDA